MGRSKKTYVVHGWQSLLRFFNAGIYNLADTQYKNVSKSNYLTLVHKSQIKGTRDVMLKIDPEMVADFEKARVFVGVDMVALTVQHVNNQYISKSEKNKVEKNTKLIIHEAREGSESHLMVECRQDGDRIFVDLVGFNSGEKYSIHLVTMTIKNDVDADISEPAAKFKSAKKMARKPPFFEMEDEEQLEIEEEEDVEVDDEDVEVYHEEYDVEDAEEDDEEDDEKYAL